MSQLEDLMKKCFDFVPMNQIKNPKVQSIKQSTNESNDLLNYCDLRLKALLVKECTLLLFEIEQVLAHWTNQSNTNWPGFNDNGFICQYEVCQPWRKPEWFTKQMTMVLQNEMCLICKPQCSFSSFTNQWMNQISTQLADRRPMDVRNPVWPVRH